MLYIFLNDYQIAFEGVIGYYFEKIPLSAQFGLMFLYIFVPYLLGSINTAMVVSKCMYHDDIRKYGSGNAGFTNVMRTYGSKAAVITFIGDIFKTVLAIMIGWFVFGYLTAYVAGFACFIGHIFPVYYQFKGGKGILCLTAILLMLDWRVFLILLIIFIGSVATTKYISFGSILSAMLYPIILSRMTNNVNSPVINVRGIIVLIAVAIAAIVVIKHRTNLRRIFNGTESKFEFKKSKKVPEDGDTSTKESAETVSGKGKNHAKR